jgi:hypothetical protein
MHIIPFSTNNILIHKGISSNNLLLGPDDKLPFNSAEGFTALNRKLNDIPFLNPVEPEFDYSGPLIIHIFQPIDHILVPHQ